MSAVRGYPAHVEGESRRQLGRYETLFPIAQGGMAEVWAARALGAGGFQKLVALKRMRPELAADAKFVTMFLDEGRLAANIASPHVVSTLDLGRADDDSLYLVMELVTGASLEQLMREARLRGERIPVGLAVDIVAQAAQGLHAAHEAKSPTGEPLEIVHRDCSPHNILVDVNGQVKITDFGIAKAMERQTRSQAGEMKGKLTYLSYEQARGHAVDRRSDIFILGIVAWEVLAGRQLFEARSAVEALHRIVTMEIPRLDEVADVSPDLAAAVAQALVRERTERYASAAAFANALLNAHGARTPPPSELGALVRRFGGEQLRRVEDGIRESLGGTATLGGAPDPDYPIPLAAKKPSTAPPPRERVRTRPLAELSAPVFPETAVSEDAPRPSQATVALPSAPPPALAGASGPLASAPLPSQPRLPPPRERAEPLPTPGDARAEAPRRERSRASVWIAVAALVVALGAAGGWWAATRAPEEPPTATPTTPTEQLPTELPTPRTDPAPAPDPEPTPPPAEPAPETTAAQEPEPADAPPATEAPVERPAPRRPRRPRADPRQPEPSRARDERITPRGERAAAIDEIPGLGP